MQTTNMTKSEIFEIFFLRHGESVGNAESRWQGQADFPLTDKGREQARSLAHRWLAEGQGFKSILSSPLIRAKETAEILGDALDVAVETDPVWQERDIGVAAGMTAEEVKRHLVDREFATPYSAFVEGGGEGDWVLYLRAGQALQSLLRRSAGKYLVVSHGGLLNQVMYAVVGITPHASFSGPRFRFKNTGFAHLTYRPNLHQWQINVINDHSHWNGKGSK